MNKRPSKVQYFMMMAHLVSIRGTCRRRKVGCVLINKRGHVLATGYNGAAAGTAHCIDVPCAGAAAPSGEGLDLCEAIHAEQNALLQCGDVYQIHSAFVTASPCVTCVKLLLNTSCQDIYFSEPYPHDDAERLWKQAGRNWYHMIKNQWQLRIIAPATGG